MIINALEKFYLKAVAAKGAAALYDRYLEIRKGNSLPLCPISIAYLEAFVQYPPLECIRIVWRKKHRFLTLRYWGGEYTHLLSLIAAYHVDNGNLQRGVLWAYKAILVTDYFFPGLNITNKREILSEMTACGLIYSHSTIFYSLNHCSFMLDWELQNPVFYSNDNGLSLT